MNALKESVLIVNDVQDIHLPDPIHLRHYAPFLAIEELVALWVERGWPIVLPEYEAVGEPLFAKENRRRFGLTKEGLSIPPSIHALLARPGARYAFAPKNEPNGAAAILNACQNAGFPTNDFTLVGFQTHLCNATTARGLKVRRPQCRIDVVMRGCDDSERGNRWSQFPKLPGVNLI